MRAGLVLGIGLALGAATQVYAAPHVGESFPEFDTKQFCRTIGRADCPAVEADARGLFKKHWAEFSAETREACTMQSLQHGGSYVLMKGCVVNRANAPQIKALFRP